MDDTNIGNERILIDTADLGELLHAVEKWRKIKGPRSTIVLQVKQKNERFRLTVEDYAPVIRWAAGWRRLDLGEIFPDMKAR